MELLRYSHIRNGWGKTVRRPLTAWILLKEGVEAFIDDSALTRGAAIVSIRTANARPTGQLREWVRCPCRL